MTIFEFISGVTDKKIPWASIADADRKTLSPFILNRWLSMNMDYIELVNELQKYTIGILSPAETYKLYYDLLPRQKQYNKYIKGKKDDKLNSELVEMVSRHFLVSEKEAKEYIEIYLEQSPDELRSIIKKYGKTDKEIAKLLKV